MSTSNWKQRYVATSKDSCSYVISTMRKASLFIARPASMSFPIRIFARETEFVSIQVSPKKRKSVLQKESPAERGTFLPLGEELGMSLAKAIVEGNVQVHDETLGFVPLKVTGVPEDEQVFFENGDFEGILKHMREMGEIGTAKPSKKAKKSKNSK